MVELQLFAAVQPGPSAIESALLDWVVSEAKRQYPGTCPRQWYTALMDAAKRIANPNWRDLSDFPELLAQQLTTAHYACFRTMEANYVTEAPTHELRAKIKAIKARRPSAGDEWYENIVERSWIEEELRERAIIADLLAKRDGLGPLALIIGVAGYAARARVRAVFGRFSASLGISAAC